jgi:N utilization substance protein A
MTANSVFSSSLRQDTPRETIGRNSGAAQLALEHALNDIPGMLASMLPAFGRNGIRTIEDLAACATDDLLGWTERSGDVITMHPGILAGMALSRKECDAIILHARVRVGWIEPAALRQ